MTPVTDPALLAQLEGSSAQPALKPVTDPKILAQLNASAPSAPAPQEEPGMSFVGTELALSEAALNMGTGLVAKPLSDVAGVTAAAMDALTGNIEGDPTGFKNYVQNKLTYEPKHPEGKAVAEYNPLALVGKGIGIVSKGAGDLVRGDASDSYSLRGAAGNALEEIINQAPGFLGIKGIKALGEATKAAAEKTGQLSQVNKVRKMAADEGYKVPDSQAKDTLINHVKELVAGGKHASENMASKANQGVTDGLARKMLGFRSDTPITKENLAQYRAQQGQAYKDVENWGSPYHATFEYQQALGKIRRDVAQLNKFKGTKASARPINEMLSDIDKPRFSPKDAMFNMQRLRSDAKANLRKLDDPIAQRLGKAQNAGAKAMEEMVDKNLHYGGADDVAAAFKAAREKIAQSYTIEDALNPATGEVSSKKLYDAVKSGDMVGSELRKAADFAGNFPHAVKTPSEIGSMPMNWRQMLTKPAFPKGAISSPKQIKVANPTAQRALRATVGNLARPTNSDQQ